MQSKFKAVLVAFGLTISSTSIATVIERSPSTPLPQSTSGSSPANLIAHWEGGSWERHWQYEPWRDYGHHRAWYDRSRHHQHHPAPPPRHKPPYTTWREGGGPYPGGGKSKSSQRW